MDAFCLFLVAFVIAFPIWGIAFDLSEIRNILKDIRDKMKGDHHDS